MTVSGVKCDRNGNPDRVKCRIMALDNLDPFSWEKHDCFAPVLTQNDSHLLIHKAVEIKRIPKSGDISQAFC